MRLIDYVVPDAIVLDLKAKTRDEVYRELLTLLGAAGAIDPDGVEDAIESCHRLNWWWWMTFEGGVIIPEALSPSVRRCCVAIGLSRDGIAWEGIDEGKVHVVGLIVRDPSTKWLNMAFLLEKAVKRQELRDRLWRARTREEALAAIDAETLDLPPRPVRAF